MEILLLIIFVGGLLLYRTTEDKADEAISAQFDHAADNPRSVTGAVSLGQGCATAILSAIILALIVALTVGSIGLIAISEMEPYQTESSHSQP